MLRLRKNGHRSTLDCVAVCFPRTRLIIDGDGLAHIFNCRVESRGMHLGGGGNLNGLGLSMIDTHAHLDMSAFDKDRAEVIARALDVGVGTIITVGTDLESSKKAIGLAEIHTEILAAVGFHPHDVATVNETDIANLAEIANHPRVVAIGETGLDFYRDYSPREKQSEVLKWQLDLAVELNLPIIVHCRQAEKDMLGLLRDWTSRYSDTRRRGLGVIHCFSGDSHTAQQYLDMGFYLSFGAYVGYPRSDNVRNVLRDIPHDRLLVETDCPFLPPQKHRGQRNEPSYLLLTIEVLARIRGVSLETVAEQTTQNANRLFCQGVGKRSNQV